MSNIVYGKVKQPDGVWVENKDLIARKFGKKLMACFTCKKANTCEATKIKDCKYEKVETTAVYIGGKLGKK